MGSVAGDLGLLYGSWDFELNRLPKGLLEGFYKGCIRA